MRLDVYITEQGLAPSRQRARQYILEGRVLVDGKAVTKPAFVLDETDQNLAGRVVLNSLPQDRYVSRGAHKLAAALDAFSFSVAGLTCADFGASTGGFTQVLLENGAQFVFAADVGHDQLHPSLQNSPKVQNLPGCNLRYLPKELADSPVDFICGDLSFISLTLILPTAYAALKEGGQCVFLIKPQFELDKSALNRHGVVTQKSHHLQALVRVAQAAAEQGLRPLDAAKSPILGGDGNQEFLMHLQKSAPGPLSAQMLAKLQTLALGQSI